MKKVLLVFGFCLFGVVLVSAQAGDDRLTEINDASAKEVEEGWAAGGGIGLVSGVRSGLLVGLSLMHRYTAISSMTTILQRVLIWMVLKTRSFITT